MFIKFDYHFQAFIMKNVLHGKKFGLEQFVGKKFYLTKKEEKNQFYN